MNVDNVDVNGDYFHMNISTGCVIKNYNLVYFKEKRDKISTNRYLRGNNGLPDGVDIDDTSPISALNQYVNMEYNNEHHNTQRKFNISTSNNSSVSTLTSTSVISTNYKGCSLFRLIHDKIKYYDSPKAQSRYVRSVSDVIKSQIKLLANKTCYSVILEYLLKYKDMEEVVLEMYIIITLAAQ